MRKLARYIALPAALLAGAMAHGYEYKEMELLTPEAALLQYGHELPDNVKTNWNDFEWEANTPALKIRIGEGRFKENSSDGVTEPKMPLWIEGSGKEQSELGSFVYGYGIPMRVEDVTFNETEQGRLAGLYSASTENGGGATVSNCTFRDYSTIIAGTDNGLDISDCEFIDNHPNGMMWSALYIMDMGVEGASATIRRNLFENCDLAVLLYLNLDMGTASDTGDNVFRDCRVAIENQYDGDVWALGNCFDVDGEGKKSGRLLTDPEEIRARQLAGPHADKVHVSGLAYDPLETEWQDPFEGQPVPVGGYVSAAIAGALGLLGVKKARRKK